MNEALKKELLDIRTYVEESTGVSINKGNKSRKRSVLMPFCLYYMLCKKHTIANYEEIGKICGKNRATVYESFIKNQDEVLGLYRKIYNGYEDYKLTRKKPVKDIGASLDRIALERDGLRRMMIDLDLEEQKIKEFLLLREVRNEKVLEILKMVKPLSKDNLDVLLERLPPIIKMLK